MLKTFKEFVSSTNNNQSLLNKLAEIAWTRYSPETKDFFEKLAVKDPDIRNIYDQMKSSQNDPDVISKNASDSNFGNEEV
jgi:hypothetical protein